MVENYKYGKLLCHGQATAADRADPESDITFGAKRALACSKLTRFGVTVSAYSGKPRNLLTATMLRTGSRLRISFFPRAIRTMSSSSSSTVLTLQPPSLDEETAQYTGRVLEMNSFFGQSRFANIKRPYSASDVASKQGSLPVLPLASTLLADKLFSILSSAADAGKPVHTMGAIDPVQMTQMARYQEVVYISGWAASSVLTTGNNDVGPDLGFVCYYATPVSFIYLRLVITHTLLFPIKYIEYFVPNNYTTRNIMMNG